MHFTLRSKCELHALKLYLYLASSRDGKQKYVEASYEKIFERTGISERDIRRAIAVLIGTGLLRNVERQTAAEKNAWGPNKYFLEGSHEFFAVSPVQEA